MEVLLLQWSIKVILYRISDQTQEKLYWKTCYAVLQNTLGSVFLSNLQPINSLYLDLVEKQHRKKKKKYSPLSAVYPCCGMTKVSSNWATISS